MQRFLPFLALFVATSALAQSIEVVNNQPFEIDMPVTIRGVKHLGQPQPFAQQHGKDLHVHLKVPANSTVTPSFTDKGQKSAVGSDNGVDLTPTENGVALSVGGRDLGRLAWGIFVGPAPTVIKEGEQAPSTKRDFAAAFQPLDMEFKPVADGQLLKSFLASGSASGLKIQVELLAYRTGFLDIRTTVSSDASRSKVYAAVVCRWEQPKNVTRSFCYDNVRSPIGDGEYSRFREGVGRFLYILRGVDWINSQFKDGPGALWLNDFTASFTYLRKASGDKVKQPARWVGANTAYLGQEVQIKDGAVYSITEIARPNIKIYEPRLEDNILPGPDQPLTITSRIAFDAGPIPEDVADQRFIAYAGYNPQQITTTGGRITFGVPFTRMGTNYFPYSTLGENFNSLRMEGMSKEGYWPLAPQTVLQWEKFADDIRRDLRILKSMGYELVRLHHLELLWDRDAKGDPIIPAGKRLEYLDFFFKELATLKLKALLDVKLPPKDVADLVARYRPLVEAVEYDNEVMLFQTPVDDIPVWKEVEAAVKQVAPEIPFHLTVHTNTGAFDRIAKEGVNFDRVGAHGYMDSIDAIPTARDNALAVANYAAKIGKEPTITEWNWRCLTRMTFEDRAKVYPAIFENVLAARCMPTMYQFQFQDSLAMNPAGLKGIRRYEQILLSRRLKPEGREMMKLIERYGPPDSGVRQVASKLVVAEISQPSSTIHFALTNKTANPIDITVAPEAFDQAKVALAGPATLTLLPNQPVEVPVTISFEDAAFPGFYHTFLRVEGSNGLLRYAWAEVRRPRAPKIDKSPSTSVSYDAQALDFDFMRADRRLTVVYPDSATIPELEATWTVFITLESATGRQVDIFQASDLAKAGGEAERTIILVQREQGAKPSVRVDNPSKLIIAGGDDAGVMAACMDYTVRYWKFAKDSGARKVGLVEAPKAEAGGKTDLE